MNDAAVLIGMVILAVSAFAMGRAFESWMWKDAARFHHPRYSGGRSYLVAEAAWTEHFVPAKPLSQEAIDLTAPSGLTGRPSVEALAAQAAFAAAQAGGTAKSKSAPSGS